MQGGPSSPGDIAHGLKGISATLGAIELAHTLGRIETAQRAGARAQISAELERVDAARPTGVWPNEQRTLNLWGTAIMRS